MSPEPNEGNGYSGQMRPEDAASEYNAHAFLVRMMLGRLSTATLVKVVAVTNAGGVSPVGFVDIHPLVNQIDANGNAVPHGTIFQCPYFRLQGGANAIILDPQVGDLGIAIFADHDISSVSATRDQANPGSRRRFAMADGLYIGGVLNGAPSQYVGFTASGINIVSPVAINLTAPLINLHATQKYMQDVGGYGEETLNDGSGNITINTYKASPTSLTTNANNYSPPAIP